MPSISYENSEMILECTSSAGELRYGNQEIDALVAAAYALKTRVGNIDSFEFKQTSGQNYTLEVKDKAGRTWSEVIVFQNDADENPTHTFTTQAWKRQEFLGIVALREPCIGLKVKLGLTHCEVTYK